MSSATLLEGEPVAAEIRESVRERVERLDERGVTPTLGTLLVSDDPNDARFVDLKHEACADLGVSTRDVRLDPEVSTARVERAASDLSEDPGVDAVFVQAPLPEQVDPAAVRECVAPEKDVDCFHPANLGRLVAGDPQYVPATPAAVRRLLDHYDVTVAGADVAVVGRSPVIGLPLANLLWNRGPSGDATVTVCHTRTRDLGAKTRAADVVVTAAGVPGLVDESMLAAGAVVVDVSANRRTDADGSVTVVGDVEFESAAERADAITPVPGGVGPLTLATLLDNVVTAAEGRSDD